MPASVDRALSSFLQHSAVKEAPASVLCVDSINQADCVYLFAFRNASDPLPAFRRHRLFEEETIFSLRVTLSCFAALGHYYYLEMSWWHAKLSSTQARSVS